MAENWFLVLLQQAPTPHQAQKLTRKELRKLLNEHRIRHLDADTLQQTLRQPVFPGVDPMIPPEAIEVNILVPQLQLVRLQIKDIEGQMDAVVEHLRLPPAAAQLLETNSD